MPPRSMSPGPLDVSWRRTAAHCPEQPWETEMSATPATIVRPEVTTRRGAFARLVGAWQDGIARCFARRAAIASLSELDDHVLRDIGLERSQIKAAVHGFIPPSE